MHAKVSPEDGRSECGSSGGWIVPEFEFPAVGIRGQQASAPPVARRLPASCVYDGLILMEAIVERNRIPYNFPKKGRRPSDRQQLCLLDRYLGKFMQGT